MADLSNQNRMLGAHWRDVLGPNGTVLDMLRTLADFPLS